jgi:hypothetical protein
VFQRALHPIIQYIIISTTTGIKLKSQNIQRKNIQFIQIINPKAREKIFIRTTFSIFGKNFNSRIVFHNAQKMHQRKATKKIIDIILKKSTTPRSGFSQLIEKKYIHKNKS